ncbi:UDP-glucose 4-epimerase, partial [mine drainage metagenome]
MHRRVTVILVTGGAGYVGSAVTAYLRGHGEAVVVVDDLSTGHRDAVAGAEFVQADIADQETLRAVIRRYGV